ncbi:MAG: HEAT repeat domain-containing protein [Vicinamibacterales bacterium]
MTFASVTLAAALAFAGTPAQTPPPPPPPPPVEIPVPVPAPAPPAPQAPVLVPGAPPAMAPMAPPLPFEYDFHLDRSAFEMQAAIAKMPPIEGIHSKLFDAEMALAKIAPFEHAFEFEGKSLLGSEWGQTSLSAQRSRENSFYESGRSALDRRNWSDAINRFEQVAQLKGTRADAALYWKAYAQGKLGQRAEALATIDAMVRAYPQSRYLSDARALELELKSRTGPVSPEAQQDEDLKILAIQGLQHSDPEQAIPLLEKIINSSNAPRVRERALYVLALSSSPRAQEILLGIAKGGANPDLQRKAIDYLATHSRRDGRSRLEEVYRANTDPDVRARVLRAYMSAGDRPRLLAVAQTEQNEELRMAAIRYLGSSAALTELGQLYDKESSKAIRLQIVRSLASAGAIDRLQQIARAENDQDIRLQAIRSFASVGRERTGTVLQDMYAKETSPDVKRAIIQALHQQNNPEGLVAAARRETDPKLKEEIVRRLSTMTKSKVALDYLMELLNK